MSGNTIPYPLDFSWEHPWPRSPVPKDEVKRVEELGRYNIIDTEKEEMFGKLCDIVCRTMKCPISAISFIDKDRQWFKASTGLTQSQIPRDVAFCAHSIMTPEVPLIIADASKDKRFSNNPLVTRASSIRFYASIPICSSTGYAIGSVFVFDTKPREIAEVNKMVQITQTVRQILEKRAAQYAAKMGIPYISPQTLQRKVVPRPIPAALKPVATQRPAPVAQPPQQARPGPVAQAPQAQAPSRGNSSALVARPQAAPGNELALAANGGAGPMGSMLMDLLAKTTDTQQQLAAQQGVMFQTLGKHGQTIAALTERIQAMEARLSNAK